MDGRIFALDQMRGLTRYSANLARALAERSDIDLVIICKEPPAEQHLKGLDAEVWVLPAGRERTWSSVTLPRAIRRARVDVFHAVADRGLPFIKVCPLVITIHGSYERAHWRTCFPDLKSKAWYWIHATAAFLLADRIVTVSKAAERELLELRVGRSRQLRSIHLAAAPEFLPIVAENDRELLNAYDVRQPYILFVGGYDRHKNVETLVAAFEQLDRPSHQLVVVADHQWRFEELHRAWRKLRTFDRLRCIQADPEDVPALYRNAEVCVVPSLWDSFGLQLIESMACGTPVLASDIASFREVGADAILTFNPNTPGELAALLERVLDGGDLRDCLRRRGLRRATGFSWQQTAQHTVEIYREVVGRCQRTAT
jgi:glycosyltransferase involved in cell wall biosynthesis